MSQDLKVVLKFTTTYSAQGFDDAMVLIGVPVSSPAHFAVDNNFQNLHPPGREAFILSIEDTVVSSINPKELRIPSMHMQVGVICVHFCIFLDLTCAWVLRTSTFTMVCWFDNKLGPYYFVLSYV